jgi:hypothetical protein
VQMLPVVLVAVPGAAISVMILSRYGRYKFLHGIGFAIVTIGLGLFSTLDQSSDISAWICFQVLIAIGTGMVLNTLLPAFQAAQPESDQATATATWPFIRSFGCIWGVTIPAAIFNNRLESSLGHISDSTVRGALAGGQAYGRACSAAMSRRCSRPQSALPLSACPAMSAKRMTVYARLAQHDTPNRRIDACFRRIV